VEVIEMKTSNSKKRYEPKVEIREEYNYKEPITTPPVLRRPDDGPMEEEDDIDTTLLENKDN
jgi:hypothetical protein